MLASSIRSTWPGRTKSSFAKRNFAQLAVLVKPGAGDCCTDLASLKASRRASASTSYRF